MNCAIIENGIVTNLIVIAPWNLPEFPNAIQLGDRYVAIGDEYRDGKFWRDGMAILTESESLQQEADELLNLLGNAAELEYMNAMEEIENV